MNDIGILLIAHGSGLPFNELVFSNIKDKLADKLNLPVEIGYIRYSTPSIGEAVASLDAERVIALPLMLSHGRFTKVRIPEILDEIDADVSLLSPIGFNPEIADILSRRVREALAKSEYGDVKTGVVLLSHGSRLDFNEEFLKDIYGAFNEITDYPSTYAFMKFHQRDMNAEIDRFAEDNGLERIVVAPVFVAPGIHTMTDIPIVLGLMDPPEPCPFMKDGKHHPDHHGHNDDPTHRPQHHNLKPIGFGGEVLLAKTLEDDDVLVGLFYDEISSHL